MTRPRTVGITVLGDFILSEGIEAVLENIVGAGATAVAVNPTLTAESAEGEGSFQPPADAGSSPRLFDRPLFGKRSLWVHSGPSYRPDETLYAECPYRPRQPNELTERHVFIQLPAARPSGLRDEDRPRLPDGSIPPGRMADTASLASPAVRAWNRAYVADLLAAYPGITGFRIDWPEYPCYTLGELFQDFGPHVEAWAGERDVDFPTIRDGVKEFRALLRGGLTNDQLEPFLDVEPGGFAEFLVSLGGPVVAEWLNLKAALSVDLVRDWRDAIDSADGSKQLMSHAFMPPWTEVTGLDFAGIARFSDAISPKLYTMHWAQMITFWGSALKEANPGLDESLLVRTLVRVLDMADGTDEDPGGNSLADYRYPEPHEPHPVADNPQRRKINQVVAAVGDASPVWPLVHGYGPDDDFHRRLGIVADSEAPGVWINRYGYLSDRKLASVGELVASRR